jgi:nucleoside-diphosphate-sugar epimerase
MGITTILGAGGPIANELAAILAAARKPFRLVGRNPKALPGSEVCIADLADYEQAMRAVAGSSVVHLLVGLPYDLAVWRDLWPKIMANTIEACQQAGARLIFFDNVYMYGRVVGPMTENTPYDPCSKKGEVRAQIASMLMDEIRAGRLTAMIARAADFYGPETRHGVPNVLVFEPFAAGKKASWLVNAEVPHSLTFTPDAARALAMLQERESAWNQVWHLPTAPSPPTGREFITLAAEQFGVPPRYRVLNRPMLRIAGWFNSDIRESYEMLYQSDSPYLFDSSKFAREFGFSGTPYAEGVRIAAASYRRTS